MLNNVLKNLYICLCSRLNLFQSSETPSRWKINLYCYILFLNTDVKTMEFKKEWKKFYSRTNTKIEIDYRSDILLLIAWTSEYWVLLLLAKIILLFFFINHDLLSMVGCIHLAQDTSSFLSFKIKLGTTIFSSIWSMM